MKSFKIFIVHKLSFWNAYTFFVIEAEGYKFEVLGLLVAFFQQLKFDISCRLPLNALFRILILDFYVLRFFWMESFLFINIRQSIFYLNHFSLTYYKQSVTIFVFLSKAKDRSICSIAVYNFYCFFLYKFILLTRMTTSISSEAQKKNLKISCQKHVY